MPGLSKPIDRFPGSRLHVSHEHHRGTRFSKPAKVLGGNLPYRLLVGGDCLSPVFCLVRQGSGNCCTGFMMHWPIPAVVWDGRAITERRVGSVACKSARSWRWVNATTAVLRTCRQQSWERTELAALSDREFRDINVNHSDAWLEAAKPSQSRVSYSPCACA